MGCTSGPQSPEKPLSELLWTGHPQEFDRRLQEGLRKPGGSGEDMRRGNLLEQLTRQRGITIQEALRIAREPRGDGKTYLELCHTHEGWIEAREALGLGRPADA